MVAIDYNETTKKITLEESSIKALDESEQQQATATVDLINRLMTDLVAHNGDIPPPSNVVSKNITVGASKIANNGVKALMQNKPEDAIKLLSTALEMVLRRPMWEPTLQVLEEVTQCLMPRCDAYVSLKRWADAYADASLLMLMKPQDAMNHYRKGMILISAGRRSEAREFLMTATRMAPTNNIFQAALKSLDNPQ